MLGGGGVPPRPEAMLQHRTLPGPIGSRPTQPRRHGDPGVRAALLALLHHRGQLVRGQDGRRPGSGSRLSIPTSVQNHAYCVTPMPSALRGPVGRLQHDAGFPSVQPGDARPCRRTAALMHVFAKACGLRISRWKDFDSRIASLRGDMASVSPGLVTRRGATQPPSKIGIETHAHTKIGDLLPAANVGGLLFDERVRFVGIMSDEGLACTTCAGNNPPHSCA